MIRKLKSKLLAWLFVDFTRNRRSNANIFLKSWAGPDNDFEINAYYEREGLTYVKPNLTRRQLEDAIAFVYLDPS